MKPNFVRLPGPGRPSLTLLVDRDPDTRRMYAEFLTLSGACQVEEAEDGRDALAKAISLRPDIIVTETRLQGLSGFDLCALLKRDTATSAIPIIFVTGDAFQSDLKRAERAGADAVLTKPCLPDTLFTQMQAVLGRARGAAAAAEPLAAVPSAHGSTTRDVPPDLPPLSVERKRVMLSRAHFRHDTTAPAAQPPALICPDCDQPLRYVRSHIGGVSARHPEQWDYYDCPAGCGTFQYRARTRKLRKV